MAHGIFLHRADSIYNDQPEVRYQFPPTYLSRAKEMVGDWVIYLEPKKVKGGSKGYYAVAHVEDVVADPDAPGMHIALITPGSYLDFPNPVAFSGPDYVERGLLNASGRLSGRPRSSVRLLSREDYNRIIAKGLGEAADVLPRIDTNLPVEQAPQSSLGVAEPEAVYTFETERPRVPNLGSRWLRDRVFRQSVLNAYDRRCALTGLRLINGGGRVEAEADHIQPVAQGRPDKVQNGLALSGTVHWMFDRGLISLDDDLRILVSRHVNDQDGIRGILNVDGRAHPPARDDQRPHPTFLGWHRDNCFKG